MPRHIPELERPLLVPDPDRVRVVFVLRLGNEREPLARIERRVFQRLGPKRDSRRRHGENARILPVHDLTRRRVPEPVARLGALEQQTQPLAQSSAE